MEWKLHYIIQKNMLEQLTLVCIYQGQETIIDFKQANKPKKVDYIQDYFLTIRCLYFGRIMYVYKTNITLGVILYYVLVDNFISRF